MSMHIAIFGGGQLAQMTAQAGISLGFTFSFIVGEGEDTCCVDGLGNIVVFRQGMDAEALFNALKKPDVITVEKEMVDTTLMAALQQYTRVSPNDQSVYLSQNRIREKNFLRHHGIPTAEFEIIETQEQLESLPQRLGFPIYIKAAESGYDGYNQWRIQKQEDLSQVLLSDDVVLIAEKHIEYSREISVIAARRVDGDIVYYPLMENRHEDGVLISTIAPAPQTVKILEEGAIAYMETIMSSIDYVGILTIECFDTEQGLVVNELAPRVHNSGHWSIEACETSQFENHCRAIANIALGPTTTKGVGGIVNMLGKHGRPEDFAQEGMFYHAYGKEERPRRKLGHIAVLADNHMDVIDKLNKVLVFLYKGRYKTL
ncbi:5-(carboxyamino)imidazole ribonucleotide synthase [Candidatus Endobugula sertula]|uniref:N5-carboxyaminoimidazole ribonucleotide synthase n=1 Tax=Candidatus Endobugula sertula TaxID=62101 RepID=A0A1D2QSJ1_9GAMM|nr:5-(carboxyamino)imidazole ribonucleotide synthase [Candidatus Endobugula sertula]